MENRFSNLISFNFVKRFLSATIIIPVMLIPILLGGYVLIITYLIILSFIIDEIFHIIRNSFKKIFSFLYFLISVFSIIAFIILLISSDIKELFITIIIIIWIFDTFAYLGGSIIKGKKIFPKISEGKTFSGLFTGTLGVIISYVLIFNYINYDLLIPFYYALILIILSFIGDTVVSILKRQAFMKDSGNLIPGHGGFLDRLDSFIFVFFVVDIYYFVIL
tara:strand:+ start:4953 stop:5612 length:660 start_codon:yes stop_codon:yes gene_type:complete